MIPIRDLNHSRTIPVMVYALIAANVAVFVQQLSLSPEGLDAFVHAWGLTPRRLTLAALGENGVDALWAWPTLFSHMFIHGGFMHIIGNLWFLWLFGDNVEDALGHVRFLFFYLCCGLAAAMAESFTSLSSTVPMVGASGAIAGVMGAYLWLFPRARILTLVPIFVFLMFLHVPAVLFIGLWFLVQVLNSSGSYALDNQGGVAWMAHIGGFVSGILLLWTVFRPRRGRVRRAR